MRLPWGWRSSEQIPRESGWVDMAPEHGQVNSTSLTRSNITYIYHASIKPTHRNCLSSLLFPQDPRGSAPQSRHLTADTASSSDTRSRTSHPLLHGTFGMPTPTTTTVRRVCPPPLSSLISPPLSSPPQPTEYLFPTGTNRRTGCRCTELNPLNLEPGTAWHVRRGEMPRPGPPLNIFKFKLWRCGGV